MNELVSTEPTHWPFTAKQPEARLIPFAKVEEAVVDETFKRSVFIPPAKVEVAVVVEVIKGIVPGFTLQFVSVGRHVGSSVSPGEYGLTRGDAYTVA